MIDAGWVVHYRSHDHQGGFWKVTPKGPFKKLSTARTEAERLRKRPHLNQGVAIKLRVEIGR